MELRFCFKSFPWRSGSFKVNKISYHLAIVVSCRQGVTLELNFCQISIHNSILTGFYSHFSKMLHMGQLGNFRQNHPVGFIP